MKKRLLSLLLAFCFVFTGCASKHMQPVSVTPTMAQLSENQSAVIFFRDTSFGGAIQAPIAEASQNDLLFVGIVSANSRILHKTTPGKHLYVIGGEGSSLLEADLAPGKFHYVLVNPKMGMWKARFELVPINNVDAASEKFRKDVASCAWYAAKPEAAQWFANHKQSMWDKLDNAIKKHDVAQIQDKRIMYTSFGVDRFIP